ncbi:MAG: alpha-amylase family glycosyl hydrolase [Planctomycetota bacterium]
MAHKPRVGLSHSRSILMAPAIALGLILAPATSAQPSTPAAPATQPAALPTDTRNLTIYEVNLRQATAEGTLDAFRTQHLDRLADMGVGVLWLMPIHPIGEVERKGALGSYYAATDYKAVNPEFGTQEDFREFVDAAHARGMLVILDWVANHTAWDHNWTRSHPQYYVRDREGGFTPPNADWSDVIELDFEAPGMAGAMLDAMRYWVVEFDVDGYRCDVANEVPTPFWRGAIPRLRRERTLFMLAEANDVGLHQAGFDATYGWGYFGPLLAIRSGRAGPEALWAHLAREQAALPRGAFRMLMTSNHDENSWNETAVDRWGPFLDAATVLTFTLPGMPLIYNGQEVAITQQLEFFEKDPIDWGDDIAGHPASRLYTELVQLKREHPALAHGPGAPPLIKTRTSAEQAVFAFRRMAGGREVRVAVNCTDEPTTFNFGRRTPEVTLNAFGWAMWVDGERWGQGKP